VLGVVANVINYTTILQHNRSALLTMFSLKIVDEVGQIEFCLVIQRHQSVKLALFRTGITYRRRDSNDARLSIIHISNNKLKLEDGL